eukprot:206511-Pyramimonas_sp.AAC.1
MLMLPRVFVGGGDMRRRKMGREVTAQRTWQYPLQQFFGDDWWDCMLQGDFHTWAVVTAAEHIHKYFQPQQKGGGGDNYEKEE